MATVSSTPVPEFKIVSRLDGVPAIHDSVAYAQSILNSTQTTAQMYQLAAALAARSYDMATPILSRTKPILESADGLAVATFDRAQATFPYPFKTPTEDLVVVKQAKAVYDARLAPMLHNAQPVLHDVFSKTAEINSAIGARAAATIHTSQDYTWALVQQLRTLAEHGKEIPGTLLESVQKATTEIKGIVLSKDATLQEKSNKVGAYVIDHVKPIVDEIYNYVLGAKNKAQSEAAKAADQAGQTVDRAADQAGEKIDQAVDQVDGQ